MAVTLKELQEESRWLLRYASNVTSERGEDGIISKALELLPERNGWCIEFGAWDGKFASNTYNLIVNHGYHGVLIESDPQKFKDLCRTHDPTRNSLINATVGFTESDSLDAILEGHGVPSDIDLVSIDIDGNDYHAWAAIKCYRPKLVLIEFNPTMAANIRFVQERDSKVTQGSSALSLAELGKTKGYELISMTGWNMLFADATYFSRFSIPDNSLVVLHDFPYLTQLFHGYDGEVFLSQNGEIGNAYLVWNPGVFISVRKAQALPKCLRKYPTRYTRLDKWLLKWWLRLRWRGII
jgi:hypothetical protein